MHFFARAMGARHSSLLPARQLNMGYNHPKICIELGGQINHLLPKAYDKALDLAIPILCRDTF